MQTFLPYPDFKKSLASLDYRRLGKQRVEAMQIIKILDGESNSWRNHPAVLMWEGYRDALVEYHNICISEWVLQGYNNNMPFIHIKSGVVYPWWLGNENFHKAMRARLIEKKRDFYLPQFPDDEGFNDSKYLWPNNKDRSFIII